MKVETIPLETLIPYANNAKRHSGQQVAQIAASVREYGFTQPVLIDAQSGIIAGHGRVLAARKLADAGVEIRGADGRPLPPGTVPCLRLAHLTEAQRRAYVLVDNRLAETGGGWDEELLRIELTSLRDDHGVDPELLGFGAEDLARMLADDHVDYEDIEAEADEARPGAAVPYLAIDKVRIPLDPDELDGLRKVLDRYAEEAGTTFGFGAYLLRKLAA